MENTIDAFHYLKQYSKFNNLKTMNEAVKQHIYAHYKKLNKTDKALLECLARHSLKYYGVSHLLSDTIANEIDRSPRTVRRITKKLKELNIIEIIETKKKSKNAKNLKGANIFVILPFDSSILDKECPNENVRTKMSERSNNEKPQNNNNESQISEQESFNSLSSISLKKFNNTNTDTNVATIQKKYLYKKLHDMYRTDSRNAFKDFTEFKKNISSIYHTYVNKIGFASLEEIFVNSMNQLLTSSKVRSDIALYTHFVKEGIETLLNQAVQIEKQTYRDNGKQTEIVPDWFENRNEDTHEEISDEQQRYFNSVREIMLKRLYQ